MDKRMQLPPKVIKFLHMACWAYGDWLFDQLTSLLQSDNFDQKNHQQENATGRSILTNLTDREIYNCWKVELGIKGISPEDLLAQYEAAGMTDYVQKFREVIQKMEGGK